MAGIGKNNHTSAVMRTPLPVEPRLRCVFVVKCPVGPSNSPLVVDGNIYWRQESNETYITGSSPPEVRQIIIIMQNNLFATQVCGSEDISRGL